MKKIVLSTFAGMFVVAGASADTSVVTAHEEPATSIIVPSAQEPEPEAMDEEGSRLGGFNLMLGIGGNFPENKCRTTFNKDTPETAVNEEGHTHGVGALGKKGEETKPTSKSTDSRFFGTVGLGGGKVLTNGAYVGIECLYDFTKSKTHDFIKSSGSTITGRARTGYAFGQNRTTMIYLGIGAQWNELKLKGKDGTSVKNDKPVLAIGLGVERSFSPKFSGRLEGEYCPTKSKKNGTISNYSDNDVHGESKDCNGKIEKKRAFNVRALISYNIKA